MMYLMLIVFLAIGCLIGWLFARFKLVEAEKRLQLMEKFQASFADQFKGISAEALRQNNETFLEIAQQTIERKSQAIEATLKPVKESLEKFEGKIQELEKVRAGAYATLKEQVGSLIETQKELRKETGNLANALRAPNVRGRWGEIQLRRVVEMAGMVEHCDFFEQTTLTFEDKKYRPDLLIKLPGNKNIVIDAKAPLEAYLEAIECQDEYTRRQKMKEHAQHIRTRMTLLSRKAYWEQFQPTPEFVILFLPGEIFFSAALEQDPALIELGVEQKVILSTPTTLIALLKSVSYGWKQENLSKSAEQISNLGRDLYKRITDMGGHWEKVGKNLAQAVVAYNKAVGSLETRVLVSARKFVDLGEKEMEPLEPIEVSPRFLQASDMVKESEESRQRLHGSTQSDG